MAFGDRFELIPNAEIFMIAFAHHVSRQGYWRERLFKRKKLLAGGNCEGDMQQSTFAGFAERVVTRLMLAILAWNRCPGYGGMGGQVQAEYATVRFIVV